MSRVGKKPVTIPPGVTVTCQGRTVSAKGAKGEMKIELPPTLSATLEKGQVVVGGNDGDPDSGRLHGLYRTQIFNMIQGVLNGFREDLEIQGVGFKASIQGRKLVLNLGFSHPIEYDLPAGVNVNVDQAVNIQVAGVDKQIVGNVAARIRAYYPAEPYKGKGVRYKGEHVRRKVGKTVA